jgi:hypothetical protein
MSYYNSDTPIYNSFGEPLVDENGLQETIGDACASLQGDMFVGPTNLPDSFQQYSQNTIVYDMHGTPLTDTDGTILTLFKAAQKLNIRPAPLPIFSGASIFGS